MDNILSKKHWDVELSAMGLYLGARDDFEVLPSISSY
jgi:hypothetical protein